jgi:hypothetical protein
MKRFGSRGKLGDLFQAAHGRLLDLAIKVVWNEIPSKPPTLSLQSVSSLGGCFRFVSFKAQLRSGEHFRQVGRHRIHM